MKIDMMIINPVECSIAKHKAGILVPCLSYKAVFWTQGRFKKTRREYKKQMFSRKEKDFWYFYTGHLNRVIRFCANKGIAVVIHGQSHLKKISGTPNIPGITLRPDQEEVLKKAFNKGRGVIKEPTGTGKTILQLGIMSAIPEKKTLLLAHTSEIVNQTVDKIRELGWHCQQIGGGGKYDGFYDNICVATIQSFSKINPTEYSHYFDAVIVDEAHRISSFEGQYAKVLYSLHSPIRFGFTATLPTETKPKLALEAFMGELISAHTINEAIENNIIAKPNIKLIKSRYRQVIRSERAYADVYQRGIVVNYSRNKQIVKTIERHKKRGETSLIFVNKIEHGQRLVSLFKKYDMAVPFVRGSTSATERKKIKNALSSKKSKIVVATTAWREGVDIPSLDVIFNAGGGKSEIPVLQSIGRGLRRTEEKDTVVVYDFFDPSHPFLISHFGERITLYMENKWL